MQRRKRKKTVMIRIDFDTKNKLKIEAFKKGITLTQLLREKLKE